MDLLECLPLPMNFYIPGRLFEVQDTVRLNGIRYEKEQEYYSSEYVACPWPFQNNPLKILGAMFYHLKYIFRICQELFTFPV